MMHIYTVAAPSVLVHEMNVTVEQSFTSWGCYRIPQHAENASRFSNRNVQKKEKTVQIQFQTINFDAAHLDQHVIVTT
jgi:hypothetical protein